MTSHPARRRFTASEIEDAAVKLDALLPGDLDRLRDLMGADFGKVLAVCRQATHDLAAIETFKVWLQETISRKRDMPFDRGVALDGALKKLEELGL